MLQTARSYIVQAIARITGAYKAVSHANQNWWSRNLPGWRGEVASFGLWILFFFFFMPTFLWQPFHIPSRSMEATLLVGDYLFVTKYSYGYSRHSQYPWQFIGFEGRVWAGEPKRGDVAVFKLPSDPSQDFIKRIAGLPGDRIQVINGVLHVNGAAVELNSVSDFIEYDGAANAIAVKQYEETFPDGRKHRILDRDPNWRYDNTGEYVVPAGHYFMMGDNRDMSSDSRVAGSGVGFVPFENLVGRADIIFFSVDADLRWWQFWRWPFAIRYSRLLNAIR
jgi:signal peptidase I